MLFCLFCPWALFFPGSFLSGPFYPLCLPQLLFFWPKYSLRHFACFTSPTRNSNTKCPRLLCGKRPGFDLTLNRLTIFYRGQRAGPCPLFLVQIVRNILFVLVIIRAVKSNSGSFRGMHSPALAGPVVIKNIIKNLGHCFI